MKTTANLGLKKPDGNDVVNIDDFNSNADKIDLEFGKVNEKFKNIDTSADKITIKDANDNFTSTTVEGALNELFQNVDNGKSSIATAIVGKGVEASKEDSFHTLANKISSIKLASGNAQPSDVLSGKTFTNTNGNQTGTMPNRGGATTVNPGPSNQVKPSGYYSGDITIKGDANLVAENIREGANIFGITGNFFGGKKWASGIARASGSTIAFKTTNGVQYEYYIKVEGLDFKPSTVIYYAYNNMGGGGTTIFQDAKFYADPPSNLNRDHSYILVDGFYCYLKEGEFRISVMMNSNMNIRWIAYE